MNQLNSAAIKYTLMITAIAASGGESTGVSIIGMSNDSSAVETLSLMSVPPSRTPRMIEPTVVPSIHPFATTS